MPRYVVVRTDKRQAKFIGEELEKGRLKPEDTIIIPNQPRQGRWLLARVVGPYRYEAFADETITDYAHVISVEVSRGKGRSNGCRRLDGCQSRP